MPPSGGRKKRRREEGRIPPPIEGVKEKKKVVGSCLKKRGGTAPELKKAKVGVRRGSRSKQKRKGKGPLLFSEGNGSKHPAMREKKESARGYPLERKKGKGPPTGVKGEKKKRGEGPRRMPGGKKKGKLVRHNRRKKKERRLRREKGGKKPAGQPENLRGTRGGQVLFIRSQEKEGREEEEVQVSSVSEGKMKTIAPPAGCKRKKREGRGEG